MHHILISGIFRDEKLGLLGVNKKIRF